MLAVLNRIKNITDFSCMVCMSNGDTKEIINKNNDDLHQFFVDYLNSKAAAGVALIPATVSSEILFQLRCSK